MKNSERTLRLLIKDIIAEKLGSGGGKGIISGATGVGGGSDGSDDDKKDKASQDKDKKSFDQYIVDTLGKDKKEINEENIAAAVKEIEKNDKKGMYEKEISKYRNSLPGSNGMKNWIKDLKKLKSDVSSSSPATPKGNEKGRGINEISIKNLRNIIDEMLLKKTWLWEQNKVKMRPAQKLAIEDAIKKLNDIKEWPVSAEYLDKIINPINNATSLKPYDIMAAKAAYEMLKKGKKDKADVIKLQKRYLITGPSLREDEAEGLGLTSGTTGHKDGALKDLKAILDKSAPVDDKIAECLRTRSLLSLIE